LTRLCVFGISGWPMLASSGPDRVFLWQIKGICTCASPGRLSRQCLRLGPHIARNYCEVSRTVIWSSISPSLASIGLGSCIDGRVRTYDIARGELRTDTLGGPHSFFVRSRSDCVLARYVQRRSRASRFRMTATAYYARVPTAQRASSTEPTGLCSASLRACKAAASSVKLDGFLVGPHRYKGHANTKYRVESCLSPDDSHVVSGSEDGTVVMWTLVEVCTAVSLLHSRRHHCSCDSIPRAPWCGASRATGP